MAKSKVLVSSCLLGITCRWHGRTAVASKAVRRMQDEDPSMELVQVCPEMLGGLPCPRPAAKRVKGRVYETCAEKADRKNVTGRDITDYFVKGAEATLSVAKQHKCKKAIFCRMSPSCGETGITTKLLQSNGIEVINVF